MQPTALTVTLTDAPDEQAKMVVSSELARYNEEVAGYRDWRALCIFVSDPETNEVVGGLVGRTTYGLCFIDLFFLPDTTRGQGLGSRIMQQAEDEAKQRGCHAVVLYSTSFLAPGFYERLGYHAFGEVSCDPPGTSRIWFVKQLGA